MKIFPLLSALALTGCANVHVEGTEGSSIQSLARLIAADRSSRLVAIDGTAVNGPVLGSYYLKPGNRTLEFQLQTPNFAGPGKSFGHGVTARDEFVTTQADLRAGGRYVLTVERGSAAPQVLIRETPSSAAARGSD
jgi:hypothetical protein